MNAHMLPRVCVVGSINVDLTAVTKRLPGPGETVGESILRKQPGGKGANQAVAAARLGSKTRMVGAIGDDTEGRWILDALKQAGVDTTHVIITPEPTGVALIVVDQRGENQIAVCPGANNLVSVEGVEWHRDEVVLTQLEIPIDLVATIAEATPGYFALNAAPARPLSPSLVDRADLIIVNETEWQLIPELRDASLVAVTYGAHGAALVAHGEQIASAPGLNASVVNTVGAGDAFCAALTIGLAADYDALDALQAACAVGAAAVGDQSSQPHLQRLETYVVNGRAS